MPDLTFAIESAQVVPYAVAPTISFKLRVSNADPEERIHTIVLRCQIQIESTRRHYSREEQERLVDLFGEAERWSQTLRSMLWTHASAVVPAFQGATVLDVPVPCTFDFNVAATKYFAGLEGDEVPLCFQFSGTIFYAQAEGPLQVAPISWDKESRFRLPVSVWREMMDAYYPNSDWLRLRRDVFEQLTRYKTQRGFTAWEQTFENLLAELRELVDS